MTATPALTTDLQRQVLILEDDLRMRVAADPEMEDLWKQEHQRALDKDRTAASWVAWRDDRVTQAAVAWVLTTVFIRFCEDNALVTPVWITGPEGRRQEALDAQLAYFRAHPEDTDREWLMQAIGYLAGLPATEALVDSHSALHLVSPSGDAVTALLDFWRRRGDDGSLIHDMADESLSTRFLGDLYQDLSQHAKDTYALLQTPVFVEEFILDRTLEPALAERPLEGFKLIDPTCGSGHFLLGAFHRLLDRWHRHAPSLEIQARVQAALDAIHGIDLNPFAVAIARFRLAVAALKAAGLQSLEDAPAFAFHLAVGDSLIHGPDPDVLPSMSDRSAFMPFTYRTEDGPLLLTLLQEGRYDVVVGNPPYITVKDKSISRIYRSKYASVCKGSYALTVPFAVLFFALARRGNNAGWVGAIVSNSFMKREFGAPIIEAFLAGVDLRLVIDSEGAWIRGHNSDGTPTVILVGKNREPAEPIIRTVLSKGRRESRLHGNEGKGPYWSAIVENIDNPGWDDDWITVTDLRRELLAKHPWSLSGGGAQELKQRLDASSAGRLESRVAEIGFGAVTREDAAYMVGPGSLRRRGISDEHCRVIVEGDDTRNWAISDPVVSLWPYDSNSLKASADESIIKMLWPYRSILSDRVAYGKTQLERGLEWFEYSMFFTKRFRSPLSIAFAEVATHNHFVLDRGGKVFKQTAPIIKLPPTATEEDYLGIVGVLNSSVACFWLRHMSKPKGGAAEHPWMRTYQYNSTRVSGYPLPRELPLECARAIDALAREYMALIHRTAEPMLDIIPTAEILNEARGAAERLRRRMIALQEELDWRVYRLYGLLDNDLTYQGDDLPDLAAGERAFEILMAREVADGTNNSQWFTQKDHRHSMIVGSREEWPAGYRKLVEERFRHIQANPNIRFLEQPEYKRRWESQPWEIRQERFLREWLLSRLEGSQFWFDAQGRPMPRSIAQLADDVAREPGMMSVLALMEGRPDFPLLQALVRLLTDEVVPFLAAYRYKELGLRKREGWEETWRLQRCEDAGDRVTRIPLPPKYEDKDFRRSSYAKMRGKLDVPMERFIVYPDAGRETDPTPLLGWAGWDYAQQSLALSRTIGERETDGWADERLVPLVAGLAELQPWVEQWHSEVDPAYGVSLAAFCREQLTARAAQVGKTVPELAAWRPEPPRRGRRAGRSG
ncbi:MAG TPA: BREX-2 system adenine-specific DNA-methyltransferase PglX [Streptosporangiaceae bacterium]|nr:BREX-2 system adenine-specific DNA-methyltransferase PglX [Streptosporangiaceae bacterium]